MFGVRKSSPTLAPRAPKHYPGFNGMPVALSIDSKTGYPQYDYQGLNPRSFVLAADVLRETVTLDNQAGTTSEFDVYDGTDGSYLYRRIPDSPSFERCDL